MREVIVKSISAGKTKRAQAIILLDEEKSPKEIGDITGYSRSQIFELRKRYQEQGITVLEDRRTGEPKKLLTKKQREEITQILTAKTPNEIDRYYNSDYWTTGVLGECIKRTYGVCYKSKTSYYLIFKQAKFTYHKPGRVYHERDEEEVERWKNKTKPRIQRAWLDDNTLILAADEMILGTQTTTQKVWLKQGEYPQIEVSNKRENRSVYGFLNIKTGKEHAWKTERQNMATTTTILEKLRAIYPTKKLLLLWDSAGWHKGRLVMELATADKRIEIIHFPRYAPEENPQEHVWKQGRSQVTHNQFIENIDAATDKFVAYLNCERFPYSLLGYSPVS